MKYFKVKKEYLNIETLSKYGFEKLGEDEFVKIVEEFETGKCKFHILNDGLIGLYIFFEQDGIIEEETYELITLFDMIKDGVVECVEENKRSFW